MAKGCDSYRTSTLKRHMDTRNHQLAISAPKASANMEKAKQRAFSIKKRTDRDCGHEGDVFFLWKTSKDRTLIKN